MILVTEFILSTMFLVGWIGNDAISPIIGAHDPYYHVYGRVGFITYSLLYIWELFSLYAHLMLITCLMCISGDKPSSCCHYSYDLCNGCCHPYINCHHPPHHNGNICPQGKYYVLIIIP